MPQVKIYARRRHLARHRRAISEAVHEALTRTLGVPREKRFQRFIALDEADFVHPPDRTEGYTIVEISMFEGRSDETKRACLEALMAGISRAAGTSVQDVEVTVFETPRANWAIRGCVADRLALSYRVES